MKKRRLKKRIKLLEQAVRCYQASVDNCFTQDANRLTRLEQSLETANQRILVLESTEAEDFKGGQSC